ncbi:hypothetical protein INR49_015879 [Caranx melampygus]|nr:hypothetical protein INR49_015879 [Caranx melampygus]
MRTTSCPSYLLSISSASSDFFLFIPCIHCIPRYLPPLCLLCPSPPPSSMTSCTKSPPTILPVETALCVGELIDSPSQSRQPLVLGVKEVGNGVGSAEELYADNGYDYYTNQGISQCVSATSLKQRRTRPFENLNVLYISIPGDALTCKGHEPPMIPA